MAKVAGWAQVRMGSRSSASTEKVAGVGRRCALIRADVTPQQRFAPPGNDGYHTVDSGEWVSVYRAFLTGEPGPRNWRPGSRRHPIRPLGRTSVRAPASSGAAPAPSRPYNCHRLEKKQLDSLQVSRKRLTNERTSVARTQRDDERGSARARMHHHGAHRNQHYLRDTAVIDI